MGKLTVKQLEAVTKDDIGKKLFDGNGLYGRVRQQKIGLVVIFEYRFKYQKKAQTVSCGKWPTESLRTIRQNKDNYKVLLQQGINPIDYNKSEKLNNMLSVTNAIEEKQAKLSKIATSRTLRNAIEQWQKLELVCRKDRGAEAIRAIEKDIFPKLGDMALTDVTKSMLVDVLYSVVERGARVMANHLFAFLRQFYNFAVIREWVSVDPLAGLRKEKIGGREKERDRYLTDIEIVELNQRLSKAGLMLTTEIAIWIILSTCCRVGELSQACWDNIDLTKGTWFIPTEDSKNKKDHIIFLSEFTKKQFEKLKKITGDTAWCIPSRNKQSPIYPQSISKQIRDRIRDQALTSRVKANQVLLLSGGAWTPHDLRRTGATMMGEMGIMGEVIERCLNHIERNKLKRIYQRYELRSEQKEAWDKLGDKLSKLVNNHP